MTGEVLAWFRVAACLRIPVEELRLRIGRTEFLDWLSFLDWEESRVTKLDHYLAQITAEVVRAPLGNADRRKVKKDHYFVKFVRPTEIQKSKMIKSKTVWGSYLGAWQKRPAVQKKPEAKPKGKKT